MLYTKTKTISTTAHVVKIKKTNYYNYTSIIKKIKFFYIFYSLSCKRKRAGNHTTQRFFKFQQKKYRVVI